MVSLYVMHSCHYAFDMLRGKGRLCGALCLLISVKVKGRPKIQFSNLGLSAEFVAEIQ